MESAAAVQFARGIAKTREGVDGNNKEQSHERTEASTMLGLENCFNPHYIAVGHYCHHCCQRKIELKQVSTSEALKRAGREGDRGSHITRQRPMGENGCQTVQTECRAESGTGSRFWRVAESGMEDCGASKRTLSGAGRWFR